MSLVLLNVLGAVLLVVLLFGARMMLRHMRSRGTTVAEMPIQRGMPFSLEIPAHSKVSRLSMRALHTADPRLEASKRHAPRLRLTVKTATEVLLDGVFARTGPELDLVWKKSADPADYRRESTRLLVELSPCAEPAVAEGTFLEEGSELVLSASLVLTQAR